MFAENYNVSVGAQACTFPEVQRVLIADQTTCRVEFDSPTSFAWGTD
jgi:hypothetical protein